MAPTPLSIYHLWVREALTLSVGDGIYIQAETRDEQQMHLNGLNQELKLLRILDPVSSSDLITGKSFRDGRFWVFIKRVAATPFIGFLKSADGTISRITIDPGVDRLRRLRLMIEDGFTKEQIEEAEGPLSDDEIEELFPAYIKKEA